MSSFRAALFDLDGTLLDTLDDIADSMNRVLAARGFPTHGLDEYRYFVGDGARTLVTRTLPAKKRAPALVDACLAEYRVDYGAHWKDKTRVYDGIPALLDGLVARGVKLAVLSNKPHDATVRCVEAFLPRWRFDVVRGQQDGIPHKPSPAGAQAVARKLRIPPGRFLYLGDTATDMQTARAAGMFAVGALWGFRPAQELADHGARVLIARPEDALLLTPKVSRPSR